MDPRKREQGGKADRRLVRAYLEGDAAAHRTVDGWIGKELAIRFPVLSFEAEDVSQVVHGKLLANLRSGKFSHHSSLKTYVVRITRYSAVDAVRKTHRERLATAGVGHPWMTTAESPYRKLLSLEKRQLLRQILMLSPRPCRDLWRLAFVEDLSYAEIGRRLTIPPGTVKSRMWYCRRKVLALVQKLGSNAPEPGPGSKEEGHAAAAAQRDR